MIPVPTTRTFVELVSCRSSVNFQLTPCSSKALPAAPQADFTNHKDKESKQEEVKSHSLGPWDQAGVGRLAQLLSGLYPSGPPQSIPGTLQPCPFWSLSRDPTVSREVGRGRGRRAGAHLPAAPRGCRVNKREPARREGGPVGLKAAA